jgi:hypothetical protein
MEYILASGVTDLQKLPGGGLTKGLTACFSLFVRPHGELFAE